MSEIRSRGPVWSNGTVPEGTVVGRATGGDVAALTPAQAGLLEVRNYRSALGHPTVGFDVIPRDRVTSSAAPTSSGYLMLTAFTLTTDQTFTQLSMATAGTAAGATPTVCRFGLYAVDTDLTSGTLVCAVANDPTLFAATNTVYTRSLDTGGGLPASYTCQRGVRYALGVIVASAAPLPALAAAPIIAPSAVAAMSPVMAAHKSGQTDLPATFTGSSVLARQFWGRAS